MLIIILIDSKTNKLEKHSLGQEGQHESRKEVMLN